MAWMLATGAAVTLSWWGVHTVMSGTAYDPPLAVPLAAQPLSSSTHDARSPSPATPESAAASPSASPSPSPSASASPSAPPSADPSAGPPAKSGPNPYRQPPQSDGGQVKAYPVTGGRVVFDLGGTSAELVSATPSAGWRMQVWKQDYWIRVTFTRDGREVSVFCTWHDHAPAVEIVDP